MTITNDTIIQPLRSFIAKHLAKIAAADFKETRQSRLEMFISRKYSEVLFRLLSCNNFGLVPEFFNCVAYHQPHMVDIYEKQFYYGTKTLEMLQACIKSGWVRTNKALEIAMVRQIPGAFKYILENYPVDTTIDNCKLLKRAVELGCDDCVSILCKREEFKQYNMPLVCNFNRDAVKFCCRLLTASPERPSFMHMTKLSDLKLRNIPQRSGCGKPSGLWGAYSNTWLNWCRYEMPKWVRDYMYELDVSKLNLLHIHDEQSLLLFDKLFTYRASNGHVVVLWEIVEQFCDGLIFADKSMTELFYHYYPGHWANGMDVPSVCIWNTNNLGIKKLPVRINKKTKTAAQDSGKPLTKNQKRAVRRKNAELRESICV